MATIRAVVPVGVPVGMSSAPEGTVLALKLARATDPLSKEAMQREVEIFKALCAAPGQKPCPVAYDTIGDPATGLVMEWCPADLERWWADSWKQPRSWILLCEAMADICRRVREYGAILEMDLGKKAIHADIKPRNVLRAADGRWLLTDFGASKSRPVEEENWAATRMILGTENFISPEALFNARKPFPGAMDTWSIGCSFFALLRMRAFLSSGAVLPINGTHSHHFRSHRVALVADLQERRPTLFVNKDLDPSVFTSPDKLPDRDRAAVQEGVGGVFGVSNPPLERILGADVIKLLDRALCIDPAKRYGDPLELASDFEGLVERFRELEVRGVKATRSDDGNRPVTPAVATPAAPQPAAPVAPPSGKKPGAEGPRAQPTMVPMDDFAPPPIPPAAQKAGESPAPPRPDGAASARPATPINPPAAPISQVVAAPIAAPKMPAPAPTPVAAPAKPSATPVLLQEGVAGPKAQKSVAVPRWALVVGVLVILGLVGSLALVVLAGAAWFFLRGLPAS